MGRLRLGRTGAGLFRLHRGGGKHAATRVDSELPTARHALDPLAAAAPIDPVAAAALPAPPLAPDHVTSESGVALGFDDGSAIVLDPDDPRVRVFRAVARQITVR